MVFFSEIANICQKSRDFWFADLRFLKSKGWYFGCYECFEFYKCCFIKDNLQKHFCVIVCVLWTKEIHRLGPMDFKIYSFKRTPRLWLDSWQTLETFAKISSVTSISVLFQSWMNPWSLPPWILGTEWNFFFKSWTTGVRSKNMGPTGCNARRQSSPTIRPTSKSVHNRWRVYSPTGNGSEWRAVSISSGRPRVCESSRHKRIS